ncbi:hypothetical protein Tco_0711860 [Tanacetum coccineum]
MQEKLKLSKSQGESKPAEKHRMQNIPYASAVGSIMYAVRCTCHDVAFAQNMTSRFQQNLGELHWTTVKNILKYLRNTKDMFLIYEGGTKRELRVSCYTDAGYLTDADDLKSQTGYVFILNEGVVDWKSTKQSIFATSSTDVNYIAAFDASKEAVWIQKFIYGLGVVPTIEEPIKMQMRVLLDVSIVSMNAVCYSNSQVGAVGIRGGNLTANSFSGSKAREMFVSADSIKWFLLIMFLLRTVAVNNDDKNLAFLTTSSPSSTNTINCEQLDDATAYAFLSSQPQGSQLVHEDLEQIHDDDLEEMDLKWNMALLSMRARKFYQRTGRKIIIDGSSTAGIEDASEKAMCAIDGGGFDWSDMAEDEIQANMALMAFTDSEVSNDKSCSKSCLLNYEALKKQYDDLLIKLDDTAFKAATYKRGLSILEAQVTGQEQKGFFWLHSVTNPSPHPLILNRPTPLDLSYSGLEEFQQPEVNGYGPRDSSLKPTTVCDRESNNSKENTDDSLTQQPKTGTETRSVVSPLKVDKAWKEKLFHPANNVRLEEPKKARENPDAPIIEDWVSDDEEEVESTPKVEKKIPTATKIESVNNVKPSRRTVRYAEMYRSQRPRGNQRSWNGQKSDQLGCNFVFNNKACFICGDFDHIQYYCPNAYKHMVPRAVLMKTGLKTVKNAKPKETT